MGSGRPVPFKWYRAKKHVPNQSKARFGAPRIEFIPNRDERRFGIL
jgi:hypothetical protein